MEKIIPRVTNKWSLKRLFYGYAYDYSGRPLYRSRCYTVRVSCKRDLERFRRSHPNARWALIKAEEGTRTHYRWYKFVGNILDLEKYEVLNDIVNS